MRDIRDDLRARARLVDQQINFENTRFEILVSQLKAEQDRRLENLTAQLCLARKLLGFMDWHNKVRAELTSRIAAAEAAENSIKKSYAKARFPVILNRHAQSECPLLTQSGHSRASKLKLIQGRFI